MPPPTFLDYCQKVWNSLPATAKHWARDQIVWPAVLTAIITVIPALSQHKSIDWELFRTALLLYAGIFFCYGLFQFIRASWRTYQTQDNEIQNLRKIATTKTEEARRAQDEIKGRLVLDEHKTALLEKYELSVKEKDQSLDDLTKQASQDAVTIKKLHEDIRQIQGEWDATEKQLYDAKTQLATERDRIIQPDVVLVWDWTADQISLKNAYPLGQSDKNILVHNRSTQHIYNVTIDSLPMEPVLSFDPINEIPPDVRQLAVARWDKDSSIRTKYMDYFARTYLHGNEQWVHKKSHNKGFSDSYLKMPIAVEYEAQGIKWRCEFDFIYDHGGDETCFKKKSGKRLN